jgi:hypothetical protein
MVVVIELGPLKTGGFVMVIVRVALALGEA